MPLLADADGLAVGLGDQNRVWHFAGNGPHGQALRMLRAHDAVTAVAWRPGNSLPGGADSRPASLRHPDSR